MKTTENTVLITGGATGIGFALAQTFLEAGNRVIACGRRADKLQEAKAKAPRLEIRKCDVSNLQDRQELFEWTTANFPELNILINNAGIQNQVDLRHGALKSANVENEISINLLAPIHLSALFVPHLSTQSEAAIVNVTSGLAFTPLAAVPVYCATKAALHSFSLSLRHQLSQTTIKVFELVPPIVDTELDKGAREERGQEQRGIKPEEVAQATLEGITDNQLEIVVGLANSLRSNPEKMFAVIN